MVQFSILFTCPDQIKISNKILFDLDYLIAIRIHNLRIENKRYLKKSAHHVVMRYDDIANA